MLTIRSLNVSYGDSQVLWDVHLDVPPGQVVCLLGRNGVGKTTLLKSIMGLLTPRSGSITFHGEELTVLSPDERARRGLGYVPQGRDIFPDLTVEENFLICQSLAAGRRVGPAGIDPRVFELFPEVRDFSKRRGLHLSGGQKKMVAIARALTLGPSILLLDEPFEGLAPVVVSRFIEAVTQIKAMGVSLLIAESNLMTASRVADRLYAIDRGEIIFEGEPRRAFENDEVMKTIRG